ncbi:MAG: serine hydrolase [Candidatus Eremiobacteraeota bacterium]|nr:serine hydrolase [Candidatus Eremiobacteraeota bacterium]
MLAVSLVGVWAASRPAIIDRRWAPEPPSFTEHYFLVVGKSRGGRVTAFVRNPEYNAGAFIKLRAVGVAASAVTLRALGRADIEGRLEGGTLIFPTLVDGPPLRFHRALPQDFRWFYPSPTTSWTYREPTAGADGWPVGRLSDVGMRVAPIATVMNRIVALRTPSLRSPYVQSISIERHGRLVVDQYFYGFSPARLHDVRSAGKSVTTLMVGRAIEDTGAFSPRTRVLSLLPQYARVSNDGPRKRHITVADLMTMSSGLACDDNDDSSPGNEETMQSQPRGTDWYRYTLDLPMVAEPGTIARYCTAGINLLGAIVYGTTGTPLDQYFARRFARPMQFERYAMWLMPPPVGQAYMGGGDYIRPRDFLKFGALLLDRGRWRGRLIVDPRWIAQSLIPRSAPTGENDRYGYGWHISRLSVDGTPYEAFSAGGNGGQLMIVVPALDAAAMVTAGNYNQFPVWRHFLPAIVTALARSCKALSR